MRSVFKSSPPGAPRSIVRALSMPRPAYIAAHSPAGPAPTMITSYPRLALSVIRPHPSVGNTQLQSWRLGIAGECSRQLLAKPHRFDFDIGPLRTRQVLERRPAHHRYAMPIAPLLMEQRSRRLDQSLPNACRGLVAVTNNRTPDGFQGLVSEPVFAGVEEIASAVEDRLTLDGNHGTGGRGPILSRVTAPGQLEIVPTHTAAPPPVSPPAPPTPSPPSTPSPPKRPTPHTGR